MGGLPNNVDIESSDPSPPRVNNSQFLDVVSIALEVRKNLHSFRDVEAQPPEIDGITAGTQPWRPFDED